jgi:hypothetical protein
MALLFLTLAGARWSTTAPSLLWPGTSFGIVSGNAQADRGRMIVRQTGPGGSFIASMPNVQVDAANYDAVEIRVRGVSPDQKLAIFWRNRFDAKRTFTVPATGLSDSLFRASVGKDANWSGPITGLGLVIVGAMHRPIIIESVRAVSASAVTNVRETFASWMDFERWNGQSINVVLLGADNQSLALPFFIGTSALLAIGIWIALARRQPRRSQLAGALVIAAMGWLLLDARWLVNLAQQTQETAETFGGKSWRDKRLAADDKHLFDFIEHARGAVDSRPGRVFFTSDFPYFRARGGYDLLPLRSVANVYQRELYDPSWLRPGDYICFFARSGVSFDAQQGLLSWDGKPPIHAELVTAQGFGSLYRVVG